jgi:hypothetical protein
MTATDFLQEKELTAIEIINNMVLNLIIGEEIFGLNIDTSNVEMGTSLVRITDFEIQDNILKFNNNELDLSSIDIL